MKVVPVGLVGCGEIAQLHHIPNLARSCSKFKLVSICDIDPHRARAVGDRWRIPAIYRDYHELIAAEPIEALVICSSGDHAGPVLDSLRAGLDVFVEKPLCLSPADAATIVAESQRAGKKVAVGYNRLFDTAFGDLLDTLRAETPPTLLAASVRVPKNRYYRDHLDFAGVARDDGSLAIDDSTRLRHDTLYNLAIHSIACLRDIAGGLHLEYAAALDRGRGVVAIWKFGGEGRAVLDLTTTEDTGSGYREIVRVTTQEAEHEVSYPPVYLRDCPVVLRTDTSKDGALKRSISHGSFSGSFVRELDDFYSTVALRTPGRVSIEEAAADVASLDELARALGVGQG